MMSNNVGSTDRIVRIALGVALLAFFVFGDGKAHWYGLLGLIPLITGTIGICPLYRVFGISTCPRKPG